MATKRKVDLTIVKPIEPMDEAVEKLVADEAATTENTNAIVQFVEILESGVLDKGDLETGIYTTSKGIRLQAQRPNPTLVNKAQERFKPPEVPMIYDEEREEDVPVPEDPDYVKAVQEYQLSIIMLNHDIYMSHSLVLEPLPEGVFPPYSDNWIADVEMFGVEVPKLGRARMLAWLNYYALDDEAELSQYMSFLQLYNWRVREQDVRDKVESFRSSQGRDSNTGLPD